MRTYKILGILTSLLIVLVVLQGMLRIFPVPSLAGVSNSSERPQFSFRSFVDGEYQKQADRYVKEHLGFREWLIRLYNQHVWSLYGRSTNVCVMQGDDGYLFERYFVEERYESRMYSFADDSAAMCERLDSTARQLAELQHLLEAHGKKVFVAILPGKDVLYPERLPAADWDVRPCGIRAYDEYLALMDRYGINYVDVCRWLKAERDSLPFDVMTKYGTHWSNAACVYAFDSLIRYMQPADSTPFVRINISDPYIAKVRIPDEDLYNLLNLMLPTWGETYKYMDVSVAESISKPRLLVIGDSFFWNITYNFPLGDIFASTHYWFYNNSIYLDPDHDNVSQVDLSEELASTDVIMLAYCTAQLYDLGNGFIASALAAVQSEE